MPRNSGIIQYQPELSSDPTTPGPGLSVIYPKTDGKWYSKNSAGTVTEITNVASSSPIAVSNNVISSNVTLASNTSGILVRKATINAGIKITLAAGSRLLIL